MSDSAIKITRGSDILSFYPIGSIYLSVVNTNPAILFGGTWQQIQDAFLLGAGSYYTGGDTGGEATHVLTASEMPTHTHTFTGTQVSVDSQTLTGTFRNSDNIAVNTDTSNTISAAGNGVVTNLTNTHAQVRAYGSGTVTIQSWVHQRGVYIDASHTHTCKPSGTNASVGSGVAHNNMPPYLAVYAWERTA